MMLSRARAAVSCTSRISNPSSSVAEWRGLSTSFITQKQNDESAGSPQSSSSSRDDDSSNKNSLPQDTVQGKQPSPKETSMSPSEDPYSGSSETIDIKQGDSHKDSNKAHDSANPHTKGNEEAVTQKKPETQSGG